MPQIPLNAVAEDNADAEDNVEDNVDAERRALPVPVVLGATLDAPNPHGMARPVARCLPSIAVLVAAATTGRTEDSRITDRPDSRPLMVLSTNSLLTTQTLTLTTIPPSLVHVPPPLVLNTTLDAIAPNA